MTPSLGVAGHGTYCAARRQKSQPRWDEREVSVACSPKSKRRRISFVASAPFTKTAAAPSRRRFLVVREKPVTAVPDSSICRKIFFQGRAGLRSAKRNRCLRLIKPRAATGGIFFERFRPRCPRADLAGSIEQVLVPIRCQPHDDQPREPGWQLVDVGRRRVIRNSGSRTPASAARRGAPSARDSETESRRFR